MAKKSLKIPHRNNLLARNDGKKKRFTLVDQSLQKLSHERKNTPPPIPLALNLALDIFTI
jgi:hypothetical protein